MRRDVLNSSIKEIDCFYLRHRRMPSCSELLKAFKVRSKNAVFKRVEALVRAGLIEKDAAGRIIPNSVARPARLLGTVTAGFPSPAEEELSDTMSMDEYLISNPQATYLLKVDGDSMLDAGIRPGDLVLVQRGLVPKKGDVVVAQVDGAWTLKHFDRVGAKTILRAANKMYPTITPKEELVIAGVVIANVRKYR